MAWHDHTEMVLGTLCRHEFYTPSINDAIAKKRHSPTHTSRNEVFKISGVEAEESRRYSMTAKGCRLLDSPGFYRSRGYNLQSIKARTSGDQSTNRKLKCR